MPRAVDGGGISEATQGWAANPSALTSLGRVHPCVTNAAPGRPRMCQPQGSGFLIYSCPQPCRASGRKGHVAFTASWVGFAAHRGGSPERWGCSAGAASGAPNPAGCSVPRKEGLGRGYIPTLFYSESRCQERLISLLCGLFSSPTALTVSCSGRNVSSSFFLVFS